jgi:hypothetical protein
VNPRKESDSSNEQEKLAKELTLDEVQDKLDEISHRLDRMEHIISRLGPNLEEVTDSARVIREGFAFYDGMVKLMSKFTRAERLESRFGDLKKDEISWRIIQVLDGSRPLNISQITAAVRSERGTASRRIVRDRVNTLLERGILKIIDDEDERARYFALAEE